jgi:cell division protein YceG involved in septum cleavage
MISNLSSILWILCLFLVAGCFIAAFWLNYYFRNYASEYRNINRVSIEIPERLSLRRLSELLAEKKIINDAQTFYWYMRLDKKTRNVHAGTYIFDGKTSNEEVAERLQAGLLIK